MYCFLWPFTGANDLPQVIDKELTSVDMDPTTRNLMDSFNEATEHTNDTNSGLL